MSDFETFWRQNFQQDFPNFPPLPERLRQRYEDSRWLRFHSLHARDPMKLRREMNAVEVEVEDKLYLNRANSIANRVLGIGSECWMVDSYGPDETDVHMIYSPDVPRCRELYSMSEAFSYKDPYEIDPEGGPDERIVLRAYAFECIWEPREFEAALRLVVDEGDGPMWISKKTPTIFAPYDQGFDLILPNSKDIDALRKEFSELLSDRRDGL